MPSDVWRHDYSELLRLYARGGRTEAVAAIGRWSPRELSNQLEALQRAVRLHKRCSTCPNPLDGLPVKAAVMLHADRDAADRPEAAGTEQPRACPGRNSELAGAYAVLLAQQQREEACDFVRRFMLGMAEQSQRDFCLEDALAWSERGLELFPGDAELLQTAGGVYEEAATVPSAARLLAKMVVAARSERALRSMPAKRAWAFDKARRFFADAVRSDDGLVLARLRLGRVLWRLGESDDARAVLAGALEDTTNPRQLYLGRLFLGRVHEDAGRLDAALRDYAQAVAHDPQGQAAAVALAHAQVLAGEGAGARRTLYAVLPHAGRRAARDLYWDYLAIDAGSAEARFDRLRREASE